IPPLLKIWLNRILKSGMQQAVFSSSYLNKWRGNYWDNWPGLIPKPIKGNIGKNQRIPWRNFDLFPKIKPITIESQSDSEKERQSLVKSTEIENKLLEILTKNLDDSNEEKYGLPMFGINLLDYISENGTVPYNINNWLQDLQKMTIDLRD
ncbi:MAG: hypothetical protein NTY95_17935, partial [Bacteroidia bacterium]|nr:hypothetical protein [Bacteroidia bacterium]